MRPGALIALSALAVCILGCREPRCERPAIATTAWRLDSGSAFTLRLPSSYRRRDARGTDSEVRIWLGDRGHLGSDYGSYSNRLSEKPYTQGAICNVRIGGRAARLVSYRDDTGQFGVAAHWSALTAGPMPHSLTIEGTASDSASGADLLASIWSVEFRR